MSKRTVVGLAVCVCMLLSVAEARGQSGGTPASSTSAPVEAAATGKKTPPNNMAPGQAPKRVWTDDDLRDLRNGSAISTVGEKDAKKPASTAATKARPKPTSFYQNQIVRLQAQIPPIDQQITELQAVLSGKPTDEPRKYVGTKLDDWKSELAQLQKKRADIQVQIGAIEDQARHDGVPTNALH